MHFQLRDPDRTILHRALRVAIVLPPLLWFGLHVLHDTQFALVAAFGSFAALGMADFTGPRRSRLVAYLVLAAFGTAFVAIGTALSNTLWPAVAAMLAAGTAVQFAMALGGQAALGNNAGILAFVVAVMVPAPDGAIASRIAGWLVALACSALVASLLWPRHERRELYGRLADACAALAAVTHAAASAQDAAGKLDAANAAIAAVRGVQSALGFRQIGPPGHQRALLGIIDTLSQSWRFARMLDPTAVASEADRRLAGSVADTLQAVAEVMRVCAAGHDDYVIPKVEALIAARRAHRELLDRGGHDALAAQDSGAALVGVFANAFPLRVLSYITLGMAVDALVITGHPVPIDDDFAVSEPTAPLGTWQHAADVLAPHLSPKSVWLHNSLRAGVALALAVLVAKLGDVGHAFWVVLATLSILRSNVATTGSTVVSALAGTFAGFVLATIALAVMGDNPLALWITLPVAVFLAGYAPYAISFGAGQAMFALLVVELFNLISPEGWVVGAARVEAVAIGAAVALVASLIMWPKGATLALREEVAAHVRAATRFVEAAFHALVGRSDAVKADAERAEALAVRHRVDEALAAYIGERSAKHVPLATWGWLARLPVVTRGAGDAALAMHRSGFMKMMDGEPGRLFDEALCAVCAAYGELADRLDDPQRAADPALREAVADLDMIDGAGRRRAAILAAAEAQVNTRHDDPDIVERVMAIMWGLGWLGYLAHLRVAADAPLAEVAKGADVPWWR
ncbi:MAG: FUSC family protein [Burkholderiales bacterium]|nr:FUSC family protein [Burkholderiales bacterium]